MAVAYNPIDDLLFKQQYPLVQRLLRPYDPEAARKEKPWGETRQTLSQRVRARMLAQATEPVFPAPVRVPSLRIPDFLLEPLRPERGFGLDMPAGTGGSFPFASSPGWGASQWGTWGPAENLTPIRSLEAERRQRRDDELERAYRSFLLFMSPGEILPVQE